MRFAFAFLLLCSLAIPLTTNAQIGWSKHSYKAIGFRELRGDFNNDGYPDLFVYDGNTVSVLLNDKHGSFGTPHTLNLALTDATLVDFNRDGNLDVAGCNAGILEILDGNGDGSLTVTHPVQQHCTWVASGDFNGDGNPDLVVGHPANPDTGPNTVLVLLGTGDGGFLSVVEHDNVDFNSDEGNACQLDGRAIAADFTGDKITDLFITADCFNDVNSESAVIFGQGDGTGHLTFHKDVETAYNASRALRLGEGNGDGKNDVVAVGQGTGPHGSESSGLFLFLSNGDGTFETKNVALGSQGTGDEIIIQQGAFADFNGDGIKDGLVMVNDLPLDGGDNLLMLFYAGQPDGSFKLAGQSALVSPVEDMLWGDYNKDGRADVALVRPFSTDVWLNTTATNDPCAGVTTIRSLAFCETNLGNGNYHFVGTPLDKLAINAMQLYVDGVVQFLTPDDLLDTNLHLSAGAHHITAKAWDDLGAFSSSFNLTVQASCTNNTNRTVHICTPINGASFTSSGGKASVEITATAASNLSYSATQIYVDGAVVFSTASKTVNLNENLSTGTHRITVKGWDSSGAFSSTVTVAVQ